METLMASRDDFPPLLGTESPLSGKGEPPDRGLPTPLPPFIQSEHGHSEHSWASMVSRETSAGGQPEHPLDVEVKDGRFKIFIPEEAYEEINHPFQWVALARLQGSSPTGHTNFSFVFLELTRQWAGRTKLKFTNLAIGSFLIRVEDERQLQCILQKHAWSVGGKTLVTCRWQPGQPLTMAPLLTAPLWICLLKMPPNMWTVKIFNNITKGL
ncbi:hypothetical protein EJ110_NYTH44370 [Nymphaea thermarum]|nr:hypothetical protein EJ110_NYTH44370 [Nymphaea thermarum]